MLPQLLAAAQPPTQIPFKAALTPITFAAAAAARGDKQRRGSTCRMVTGSQRPDRYTYTDRGNKDGRGKIMIDTEVPLAIPLATAYAATVEKEKSIVKLSDQEVAAPPPQPFSHEAIRNVSKTHTIIDDRTKLDNAIAASKYWKNSIGKEGPFYTYIKQEGEKKERGWLRNLVGISSRKCNDKVIIYDDFRFSPFLLGSFYFCAVAPNFRSRFNLAPATDARCFVFASLLIFC